LNSFLQTLRQLGPARLAAMLAISAALLAFFIYLTSRITTPDMALLYADLEIQDSGRIASRLDTMKVSYEVSLDGSMISVPAEQVARLRVAMAEEGLPSGGSIGYEIFDRSEGIGTTNFVQNINHLRALEGELARTIRSIGQIKQARVHLVLPQRQLFSRETQEPSASIVLMTNGMVPIGSSQVLAIRHLVAAAVPGLRPQMVSVIDDRGTLLARGGEDDSETSATSAEEMRVAYENRLVHTIEDLLARSLGPGNVRAQVAAELNFDRVTESSEVFDPDGQVVRSTQIIEENNNESDKDPAGIIVANNLTDAGATGLDEPGGSSSQASRSEESVSYEISRTTRTHVREAGMVRRLTVAVMVNGTNIPGAEGSLQYAPRSEAEMAQIATLVRSAVGIDEARGDRLDVVNLPFTEFDAGFSAEESGLAGFAMQDALRLFEVLVLGLLALVIVLFVVRPLLARLLNGKIGHAGGLLSHQGAAGHLNPLEASTAETQTLALNEDDPSTAAQIAHRIDLNQLEERDRGSSARKVGEIIQKHPEEAVSIIRSWLYQET
jgi:flagellar M-ring protein FliF